MIDYRTFNKTTPMTAPVVAKYPVIIAVITGKSQWFSVLDLSNAFFLSNTLTPGTNSHSLLKGDITLLRGTRIS